MYTGAAGGLGQFTLSWSEPFSELTSDISALEMIVSGSAGVSMYARGCLSLSIKCVLYFFVGGRGGSPTSLLTVHLHSADYVIYSHAT